MSIYPNPKCHHGFVGCNCAVAERPAMPDSPIFPKGGTAPGVIQVAEAGSVVEGVGFEPDE